ncbi:hypothetical protein Hanom_Chr16g01423031 [Helianthus anomalus]
MLTNGTIVDGDVVEECKEAQVHIHPSPILITPTNKVGDEGPGIRSRRVALQDFGQFVKKRPQNVQYVCRVKEKESGFGMPTTEHTLESR